MLIISLCITVFSQAFDRSRIDSLKAVVSNDSVAVANLEYQTENYNSEIDSLAPDLLDDNIGDSAAPSITDCDSSADDDGVMYNAYIDFGERDKFYLKTEVDTAPLPRFGESFITSLKSNFPRFGPVNPSYRLGLGDEVVISVWGDVQSVEKLSIDRLGKVTPRGIGAVQVAGKSLDEVQGILVSRYTQIYSGVRNGRHNATTFVDISMGALRTKQIFVVGNVVSPGTYSVPSTVGALGAISYAGGPTGTGSLREIYIKRGGVIIDTIDIYESILSGNVVDSIGLADYDVVVVPVIQKRVAIGGAVYSPAIYELKNNESYSDLLQYCGGYQPEAFTRSFNITRTVTQSQRQTITVFESDSIALYANDSLVIPFVDQVVNTVSIDGAVQRPGNYGTFDGMTLKDLIEMADGVTEDYFQDRAEVIRTFEDFDKQVISVNIGDLLENEESDENVVLQKWDMVKIYSKWDVQYREYVSIHGEVKLPGKYFLRDSMTVQDLILLAGGFTERAFTDTVELSRIEFTDRVEGNSTKSIHIGADENFYLEDGEFLKHMDNLLIHENSTIKEQEIVYLNGEFSYPGFYAKQSDDETLLSLIQRAGGLKSSAYLEGARFTRAKDSIGTVAIDVHRLIERENSEDDIILEDGDTLFVPTEPKTVIVDGAVNYPTAVQYVPGENIRYYIRRAGGLSNSANDKSIYVILANGEVREVRKSSRVVNAGSAVIIPEILTEKEPFNWSAFATSMLAIASSTLAIMLAVKELRSDDAVPAK